MRILLVLGTRPQIIKSASIVHLASNCSDIDLEVVHTGQHYDYEMSRVFFDEMTLPDPLANLGVGSGSHAWQTGQMLMRIEEILLDHKPDLVLVPGDTNSTLAGSLAAAKSHVPIGHIEAGARSYDMGMPEEVNRRLTDHCSGLLFATTENCVRNLEKEGIPSERVFRTGDTMYDALLQHMDKASRSRILKEFGLKRREYAHSQHIDRKTLTIQPDWQTLQKQRFDWMKSRLSSAFTPERKSDCVHETCTGNCKAKNTFR